MRIDWDLLAVIPQRKLRIIILKNAITDIHITSCRARVMIIIIQGRIRRILGNLKAISTLIIIVILARVVVSPRRRNY
jgi:hypothetical protein